MIINLLLGVANGLGQVLVCLAKPLKDIRFRLVELLADPGVGRGNGSIEARENGLHCLILIRLAIQTKHSTPSKYRFSERGVRIRLGAKAWAINHHIPIGPTNKRQYPERSILFCSTNPSTNTHQAAHDECLVCVEGSLHLGEAPHDLLVADGPVERSL